MDPAQHLLPVEPQTCGGFIEVGTDPFQGGIETALGHRQKAVAVAPEQQQQRSELPGSTGQKQCQGQHCAGDGVANAGQEGEAAQPNGRAPAFGNRQQQGCRQGQQGGTHPK